MASDQIRRAAVVLIAASAITVLVAAIVQFVLVPTTDLSDDMWRYPWSSSGAFVAFSVFSAALHALVAFGVFGFGRSGVAGRSRAATVGVAIAVAGTLLLLVGELASIPVRDQAVTDDGAWWVGVVFGFGSVLSAIGFLLIGWTTLRAGVWQDWRRFTPLVTGLWSIVLVFIAPTLPKALPAAVGLYGVCLLGMAIALYTEVQREGERVALRWASTASTRR